MTKEQDFHRVILRKVGVYFEARTEDLCILGTDRAKLLQLVDLWEDSKRRPATVKPPKKEHEGKDAKKDPKKNTKKKAK